MTKRINKYISESGFCSRREADKLVAEGRVRINDLQACRNRNHDQPKRAQQRN